MTDDNIRQAVLTLGPVAPPSRADRLEVKITGLERGVLPRRPKTAAAAGMRGRAGQGRDR